MNAVCRGACRLACLVVLALLLAADWPRWGGTPAGNMASSERGLPAQFVPGEKRSDGSGIDTATTRNVRWVARLGSENYSTPTIAGGRVFIGTNDYQIGDPKHRTTEGGLLLCLHERTGKILWRLVCPKLESNHKSSQFDEMDLGLCGSVTVEGDRAYLVTNRCDVLCLDVHGLANGNDGPFVDEGRYAAGPGRPPVNVDAADADIVWRYDMFEELMLWPHDAANSAPLIHGDCLYVGTGNGVDGEKAPFPLAPSLVALDKRTGRLVARDDERIGTRVYHGQWSSPTLCDLGDRQLVVFGAGDGVCYAFEPVAAIGPNPTALKKVWQFQCNPPDALVRDGKPVDYWAGDKRNKRGNRDDGKYLGPNEIIATPVCHRRRVYVAIGQDPVHGRGRGMLRVIDAAGRGDISSTGSVWAYDRLDRSLSTVSIVDDLLFVADRPGAVHCLELESGRPLWTHPLKAEVWGSTLAADGKLYVPTRKGLFVLAAAREARLLAQVKLGSPLWATPVAASETLYVASQKYLWAAKTAGGNPLALFRPSR